MFMLTTPSPHHDGYARHFALQCLGAAAARVGADPGPAGSNLRATAAALLTGAGPGEAAFVKEGIARLVAELAERAFPQVPLLCPRVMPRCRTRRSA